MLRVADDGEDLRVIAHTAAGSTCHVETTHDRTTAASAHRSLMITESRPRIFKVAT